MQDVEWFRSRNDVQLLKTYFLDVIHTLGASFSLPAQVISTAQLFFHRFYLNHHFIHFDPRLVCGACLFLACKSEEVASSSSTACNARTIIARINEWENARMKDEVNPKLTTNTRGIVSLSPLLHSSSSSSSSPSSQPLYIYTIADLLEMEFAVLHGLDYELVVYLAHRPLKQLLKQLNQPELLFKAWGFVNDAYWTELCITEPPYIIALAAIYLAAGYVERNLREWFRTLNVEHGKIVATADRLLTFMEDYEEYGKVKTQIRLQQAIVKLNERKYTCVSKEKEAALLKGKDEMAKTKYQASAATAIKGQKGAWPSQQQPQPSAQIIASSSTITQPQNTLNADISHFPPVYTDR